MATQTLQNKGQKKEKKLHEYVESSLPNYISPTNTGRLLTSSLVDIYVGPDSTRWTLHERLLCYHSPFFASIFYADDKNEEKKPRGNKSYGLPDEDDEPFELFVGWLYSQSVHEPKEEKDVGPLLELYTLAQRLQIEKLALVIVDLVRDWYHKTSTYPGLRRVQYIYDETDEDNEMRELMVSSVARLLTTSDKIPSHWASALQRNGQLAVDIIRAIQQWHIEERSIPDARDVSTSRGRQQANGDVGFSAVEQTADTTEKTDTANNSDVEGVNGDGNDDNNGEDANGESEPEEAGSDAPDAKSDDEE